MKPAFSRLHAPLLLAATFFLGLALLISQSSAQERLSDPAFSVSPSGANNVTAAQALDTWFKQNGSQQFDYNGGTDDLTLDSPNNRYRGLTQIIDDSSVTTTGVHDFSVDVTYQGNGNVEVEVWGIEAAETFQLDNGAGNNSTGPNSDNTTLIDLLASNDFGTLSSAGPTTETLSASLDLGSTDFDELGLRILFHGWETDAGDSLTVSGASFAAAQSAAVPEPGAMVMWMIAGIAGAGVIRFLRRGR